MHPRSPPTAQNLGTLLELVKLGAGSSYAAVTSARLGKALELTQQAASRRLIELESAGFVTRAHSGRGLRVRLTPEGLRAVQVLYRELKGALEQIPKELTFRGVLFTGLGEGGYYVSLEGYGKHFKESLGFEPFAGTLNLRLTSQMMVEQRGSLHLLDGIQVKGFSDGGRTYGPVKCFRALIGRFQGAVLAIERTHYDDTVLEVISPVNLRKALKLEDGDECEVTVLPD